MEVRWYVGIGVGILGGLAIVLANLVTGRRLWANQTFERSQKIAQTIMMWLIPGSVIVVRYLLNPPPEDTDDPTVSKDTTSPYGAGAGMGHGGGPNWS